VYRRTPAPSAAVTPAHGADRVAERTREIGIRKAIGASRRLVVAQFLADSVAISTAGSVIGVMLGLSGAAAVTTLMRAQTGAIIYPAITPGTIIVSMRPSWGCPSGSTPRSAPRDCRRWTPSCASRAATPGVCWSAVTAPSRDHA
jgi:hypothetical protein